MNAAAANQPVPEPGVEPDGIDAGKLAAWGFVSVVVTVGLMFAAAALYFQAQAQLDAKRVVAATNPTAEKALTDQEGVLTSYGAPASEGQPYKIPIERAKQLVVAEAQSQAKD